MADTARTRSALQTLFADNVTGQISPQDLRDFLVSVLPAEHINAADFWAHPDEDNNTTAYSTRGWHLHSQIVSSTLANGMSFGKIYVKNTSNAWSTADPSYVSMCAFIGVAADSYTANDSVAKMLLMGVVNNPSMSDYTASAVGLPLFLCSITSAGWMSVTAPDAQSRVVGFVLPSTYAQSTAVGTRKWFFDYRGWGIMNH